jgi:hypothetical protein
VTYATLRISDTTSLARRYAVLRVFETLAGAGIQSARSSSPLAKIQTPIDAANTGPAGTGQ